MLVQYVLNRRVVPEQGISRILFPPAITRRRAAAIYLGRRFPDASCDPPGARAGRAQTPLYLVLLRAGFT